MNNANFYNELFAIIIGISICTLFFGTIHMINCAPKAGDFHQNFISSTIEEKHNYLFKAYRYSLEKNMELSAQGDSLCAFSRELLAVYAKQDCYLPEKVNYFAEIYGHVFLASNHHKSLPIGSLRFLLENLRSQIDNVDYLKLHEMVTEMAMNIDKINGFMV